MAKKTQTSVMDIGKQTNLFIAEHYKAKFTNTISYIRGGVRPVFFRIAQIHRRDYVIRKRMRYGLSAVSLFYFSGGYLYDRS